MVRSPLHLRNAPTKLMKDIGYGKGHVRYPVDGGKSGQENFRIYAKKFDWQEIL